MPLLRLCEGEDAVLASTSVTGLLIENLRVADIEPSEIDTVITRAHPDPKHRGSQHNSLALAVCEVLVPYGPSTRERMRSAAPAVTGSPCPTARTSMSSSAMWRKEARCCVGLRVNAYQPGSNTG